MKNLNHKLYFYYMEDIDYTHNTLSPIYWKIIKYDLGDVEDMDRFIHREQLLNSGTRILYTKFHKSYLGN